MMLHLIYSEFKRVPEKHGKQKGFQEKIYMQMRVMDLIHTIQDDKNIVSRLLILLMIMRSGKICGKGEISGKRTLCHLAMAVPIADGGDNL